MLRAEVHTNERGTLYVHTPLVQKKFDVTARKGQGRCLLAQVAYTINAVCPSIRVSRIVTHIDKHVMRKITEHGHTIGEILETFKYPVKTDSGDLKLDVALRLVKSYDDLLHFVMTGQPVMIMIDRDVCAVLQNEAIAYGDGEIRATVIRHGQTGAYHAMLAMGLDLSGYLVLRDSRSRYAFKGYVKIATNVLQDGWRFLDAMAIELHGFEKV